MGTDTLDGTRWRLVSYRRDGAMQIPPDGAEVTLEFVGDHIGGRGGCNRYTAQVTQDDAKMQFSAAVSTRMMCLPPLMELEQAYLATLLLTRGWSRNDAQLTLSDDAGAALLVFESF